MLRSGPEVVPVAGRKKDVFGIDHFCGDRSDKQVTAEEKIAIITVKSSCLRILEEERAHQGDASASGFLDGRVKVQHQTVAQLDVFLANRFVFRAVNPRLLIGSAFRRVVAIDRIERADFEPACQQVRRRRASEAADVVPDQGHSGNSHAHEHRRAHL